MQSYQQYLRDLKKALIPTILASLAVALVVYFFVARIEPTYTVHYSYVVSLSQRESAPDYQFDGFYAISATDLFAATLSRWASTPEVIVKAHQAAGIKLAHKDGRALSRLVSTEKASAQLVTVAVKSQKKADAEKLALGLQQTMAQNIELYHQQGIPALEFNVVTTDHWVAEQQLAVIPIALFTFLITLALIANGVILNTALKDK